MTQRIYIDTSVVGGSFDEEFKFYSDLFFEKVFTGKFKLLVSDILITELIGAPQEIITFFNSIPSKHIEKIELNEDTIRLADGYINEKVVGETSRIDCRHIALATQVNADILISWNFKHIVNINRIRGYNSVNLKNGFKILEIRTPREIIEL